MALMNAATHAKYASRVISGRSRKLGKSGKRENPFVASRPTRDPQEFLGRCIELQALFRAVARSETTIVTGDRGIGKSSFISQLEEVLRKNPEALRKYGVLVELPVHRLAVTRLRCQSHLDIMGVMGGLAGGLRRNYLDRRWLRLLKLGLKVGVKALEFLYLGGTIIFKSERDADQQMVARANQNGFYDFVEDFLRSEAMLGGVEGVVLILDEVEDLLGNVNFGSLARSTVEAMADRGFNNVCFVISGADDTAARIFEQHPSATRSFQHIPLGGMSEAELSEIVVARLAGTGVRVSADALQMMASLANQSPSRLQMIAHECYEIDQDQEITRDDVEAAGAALSKKLQVQIFGKFARGDNWEDYCSILKCISAHEGSMLTADEIAQCAGLPPKRAQSLCGHLRSGGVLVGQRVVRNRTEKTTYRMLNQAAALYFRLAEEFN